MSGDTIGMIVVVIGLCVVVFDIVRRGVGGGGILRIRGLLAATAGTLMTADSPTIKLTTLAGTVLLAIILLWKEEGNDKGSGLH